jgi:hypothetical protein
MTYIILGGGYCDIFLLYVNATTVDKTDGTKNTFYKEQEYLFNKFLKCHMKMLIGDFMPKRAEKVFSN